MATMELDASGEAQLHHVDRNENGMLTVMEELAMRAGETAHHGRFKVAVGYNVCIDRLVDAVEFFDSAARLLGRPAADANDIRDRWANAPCNSIANARQLHTCFYYFFEQGAAGERIVTSPELWAQLLTVAGHGVERIGGNAALMARSFALSGAEVLLGGRMGKGARDLLEDDGLKLAHGENDQDDVHLILEYKANATIDGLVAPRANRFIITADAGLTDTSPFATLVKRMGSFRPDAVVVAGAHMLEQLPPARWEAALDGLGKPLSRLPPMVPRHVELASVADKAFLRALSSRVLKHADSIGANEHEISDLFEALGGQWGEAGVGPRSDVTGDQPDPNSIGRVALFVLRKVQPVLSRVHIHSLHFHAVITRRHRFLWGAGEVAAAAGSIRATAMACLPPESHQFERHDRRNSDLPLSIVHDVASRGIELKGPAEALIGGQALHLMTGRREAVMMAADDSLHGAELSERELASRLSDPAAHALRLTSSVPEPVMAWTWHDEDFDGHVDSVDCFFAPVVACREPVATVGLGDSISAAGLFAHVTSHGHFERNPHDLEDPNEADLPGDVLGA